MALPVLDGNQSATTLSSVVTGGEHIVAHSVVSLGTTAISNIATAVSGVSISISGTPSTTFGAVTGSVSILGTPTVTIPQLNRVIQSVATDGVADATLNFVKIGGHQDGSNQTAHIVHVSAGGAMKVDATDSSVTFGAVRGTVTISNFPSTQTISGTVTANVPNLVFESNSPGFYGVPIMGLDQDDTYRTIGLDEVGRAYVNASGTVTVGNSVTIGSLPAISGTVTANLPQAESWAGIYDSGNDCIKIELANLNGNTLSPSNPLPISGTVTVGNSVTIGSLPAISGTVTARLQDASGNNLTSTSIGGVQRLNVSLASAATPGGSIPTFVNVYGGSDSGTVRAVAVDSSGRSVVTVSNFPATQAVSLASTTVTVSALPGGALTTRFGSVTTANTAQITSAVTNTSRKYLLAQNISEGTVTIGIGFSPTTTQGIQLTAGGGLTFDAFCPTGAVYWLGAVTGAAWTILEG